MIIAVDGPTASGKGTVAKNLADHYGLKRLDTGSLYRAVGLAVLDAGGEPGDACAAVRAAEELDLNAIDENRIRSSAAGLAASKVAVIPDVREVLRRAQIAFAADPVGAVLDGRDIGTVICPNADVKLFVTASLAERTRRRLAELHGRGEQISFDELQAQIAERDERDMTRKDSPLYQAADAHLLDTTSLSIKAAAQAAYAIVDAALAARKS
ncbi:(d)CMP kinase [Candidatus Viadribacter manganicus]|uniref:Cytidylate kinase n=1 Tax=Candidatus Viadribacter manganicus TaxID=1759059 RepID=A0A1B1AJD9_9PROT|nr:(d)CMP kinase [Candidatus Viadribacter manganicus]ANP46665.1 cytidylate kinase [Candidatus Viadribacter manganicus]